MSRKQGSWKTGRFEKSMLSKSGNLGLFSSHIEAAQNNNPSIFRGTRKNLLETA